MSKKQWEQPRADWQPLRQAVFRFGAVDDSPATVGEREATTTPEERLWDNPPEISVTPPSLAELSALLLETSGAEKVEIDPAACLFSFTFRTHVGPMIFGGFPWEIVRSVHEPVHTSDPKLVAEDLFDKRLVWPSDEVTNETKRVVESAQKATSLAWNQFILRAFDRAVRDGAAIVYAQLQSISAPFEKLPAHVWPLIERIDWESGMAVARDGTTYWSLHVAPPPLERADASSQPARERARRALNVLYPDGIPDQATLRNAELCQCVGKWLKRQQFGNVGDDTILRAAGRRK